MARDLRRWLQSVLRRAAAEIADHGSFMVPTSADRHTLETLMRARIIATAEAVGQLTLDHAGRKSAPLAVEMETKKVRLFEALRGAIDWARRHAAEMVTAVSDQVRRVIARRIDDGLKDGQGTREIAKKLRDDAPEIARARSEMIARTETHNAAETGQFETARQSGLDLVKTWVAVEDKRTRPAHAAADGQVVEDLDGFFTVDNERLKYPGDPAGSPGNTINCRCVAVYEPRIAREVTGQ